MGRPAASWAQGSAAVGPNAGAQVVTSKYNVVTFLPYFLFEMFSRAAYLYFLLQVRRQGGAGACGRLPCGAWQLGGCRSCSSCTSCRKLLPCVLRWRRQGPPHCYRSLRWLSGWLSKRSAGVDWCLPALLPLQAALSWWSVVSPFGGVGSTAALVFVLLVSGGRAGGRAGCRHGWEEA